MKKLFTKLVILIILGISSATTHASDFPVNEPMGGEPFGHSVKQISNGLYVFR